MNKTLKFITFLFLIGLFVFLGQRYPMDIDQVRTFLNRFPIILSGIVFIALYVVLTFFIWFGPKDIFRISSAIFFGAYVSTVLVWIAEMVNAFVLFKFARKFGREFVEQHFPVKRKDFENAQKDSTAFGVLALRINPMISFRAIDLGFGLSNISFKKYFFSIVGVTFLRIFWLQYILAGLGDAFFNHSSTAVIMDYLLANSHVLVYSAIYFLIVIVLSVTAVILHARRKTKG